jgi:hypothetical protein
MMLKNVKCKWAAVQQPNTTFEPVWSIDIVLDGTNLKMVKEAGLKPKVDKDGDTVFKFKRKVFRADGEKNNPPEVVDAKKEPFHDLIGNGSTVNISANVYEWENKFGKGIAANLNGVQVVDLVPYGNKESFDVIDGDTAL